MNPRRRQPQQSSADDTATPEETPETSAAPDLGQRQHTTIDLSPSAAAVLRGFRLHVLQHGPLEGLSQFDQFLIRAAGELLLDLETRHQQGAQFTEPQVRLPKGTRAGLAPGEELVRFSAKIPTALLARMRGALLWFQLHDTERAAEQIGMAPEFWSSAVLRLGTSLQEAHGITLPPS